MRVRWRRTFNPISRKPVRMKLTGERYLNARYEKAISAARIFLIGSTPLIRRMGPIELLFGFGQFCQHAEVFERSRVAGDLRAAGDLFQQSTHNFATAGFWECFGKTNFVWFCNRPDVQANMLA